MNRDTLTTLAGKILDESETRRSEAELEYKRENFTNGDCYLTASMTLLSLARALNRTIETL